MYKGKIVNVVIPAAGSGKRMNSGNVNKVYIELLGKTILERTFEAFEKNGYVDNIIVAVRADEADFCKAEVLKKEAHPKLQAVISGGKERYDSVLKGLELLEPDSLALVHDGARPLVGDEAVNRCIEAAFEHGFCAVGVPVKDTIKVVENGVCVETPDRSRLYAIHTPQGFIAGEIRDCIKKSLAEGFAGTDEAVFAEKQGKKVFIVEDTYDNIKVTTSEDLTIAEALLIKKQK